MKNKRIKIPYVDDVEIPAERGSDIGTRGISAFQQIKKWKAGSGNKSIRVDIEQGLWLGNEQFNSAPFKVDMSGNATANSLTITGSSSIDFANVTGTTKPENNATVGAKSGTNLKSSADVVLDDSDVIKIMETFYGDGSDGDVTISSDTTLTSDMFYNNLTINAGVTLNPNGYRIFVKGTLTNNRTIARNGNNGAVGGAAVVGGGAGGAGGAALPSGSIAGSVAGGAGGQGATGSSDPGDPGVAGSDAVKGLGVNGASGGKGGDSDTAGGAGGAGGVITGTVYNQPKGLNAIRLQDDVPALDFLRSSAGSGGGGGAGYGSDTGKVPGGGGGGSSGGIILISAKSIVNAGTISAVGGNGGAGGDGDGSGDSAGAGGGGGGSGGIIILIYSSIKNTGTMSVAGGTGGAGGTAYDPAKKGTAGTAGSTGKIIQLQI